MPEDDIDLDFLTEHVFGNAMPDKVQEAVSDSIVNNIQATNRMKANAKSVVTLMSVMLVACSAVASVWAIAYLISNWP